MPDWRPVLNELRHVAVPSKRVPKTPRGATQALSTLTLCCCRQQHGERDGHQGRTGAPAPPGLGLSHRDWAPALAPSHCKPLELFVCNY